MVHLKRCIEIEGRSIGPGQKPYVICELSGNHNGSITQALKMIDAAAETGCDAIKLQTYTPDTLTIDSKQPDFQINGGLWDGSTLFELYQEAHTPFEWHPQLFERAKEKNITIFSTPFDETAVDLLEDLNTPAYKIASFEIVDLPLISYVAKKEKPMIISTGLANLSEIEAAVDTAKSNGCKDLILLHCISAYPAPTEQSNLRTISDLAESFDCVVGLSDHTLGTVTSVAAVALGASVIEKHFTISRADEGPDASFSLEPDEFTRLVNDCADAWMSLGEVSYNEKPAETGNKIFRRSIYVVKDMKKGDLFNPTNIRSIRPGFGMATSNLPIVYGRACSRDIQFAEPLDWSMIMEES